MSIGGDGINAGRERQRVAEERARQLLFSILPDNLGEEFQTSGTITVEGAQNIYVLSLATRTEIRKKTTGEPFAHACLQLSVSAPQYDRLVAEYLLITNNEDLYWHSANIFPQFRDFVQAGMAVVTFVLFLMLVIQLIHLL